MLLLSDDGRVLLSLDPAPDRGEWEDWAVAATHPATLGGPFELTRAKANHCASLSQRVKGYEPSRRRVLVSRWTGRHYFVDVDGTVTRMVFDVDRWVLPPPAEPPADVTVT